MPSKAASRTNANPDDVFLYCDSLKARNESVTVEKVAGHFSASNSTVGPLVAAWREARAKQPVWPMPSSLNDRAQEMILSIWLLASETGQAQLQVEVNTLSSALAAERAKVLAGTQIQELLQGQLDAKEKSLSESEAQLMAATQSTLDLTHELDLAKRDLAKLKNLGDQAEASNRQLHETQLELAKLQGKHEELHRQFEQLQTKQGGAK